MKITKLPLTTEPAIVGNNMLPAALSSDEQKWFDIFESGCKKFDRRYVITWWLRIELKIPTQKINYHLSKLSKKGILKKETDGYCTKFYYATDFS